ncbi:MAG TPA: UDP-N-acetylglucosamine 1-carboxyvinyltransferase [Balneolaceae bacterium]|nr:UDP-N-acetylglucosamine 1-carboxyvinyltransferase [Balneolaceae bacterium]
MDKFIIEGPTQLNGTIPISGSKNAALPLMAAALLADSDSVITNVPRLKDIYTFSDVIRTTGAEVNFDKQSNRLHINPAGMNKFVAPYELVRKMRASFYMLGALTGRFGKAKVSLPGGCAWGPRPVDLHLQGMRALGIDIELEEGYVLAKAPKTLEPATFTLNPSSVGATVNLVLASALRAEHFVLKNAAREPDVVLLCEALKKMGADINGIGTEKLTIKGVDELKGLTLTNAPDRIETGTFMMAAGMLPGSKVTLTGANPDELGAFPSCFKKTGINFSISEDEIYIKAPDKIKPVSIETAVYPGFATDLQAQWATMMTQADGKSTVTDNVYSDRFSYVPELKRLGADISVGGNKAHIQGKTALKGTSVMSTDLRASVSLVMAAMAAAGSSEVLRVYHLDRGYESLERKLNDIGAKIERVEQ